MSKGIKSIASIALPIVGNVIAPGIGGIIGGAAGGLLSGGGLPAAVLGAVGGYASAGATNSFIGNAAGAPLSQVAGNAALQGPTFGSGAVGAITGGGARALSAGLTQAATAAANPLSSLTTIGNQLLGQSSAEAAEEAAKIQAGAIDRAIATRQPYNQLGTDAVRQIQNIQADKAGYIQNNPFYNTLAKDAERRLLANQATKGKVASGETANELQSQLLQIGNGLVDTEINRLQDQAQIGQGSASAISTGQAQQGEAKSAGVVGANNAYKSSYENQIGTLLALQNLNRSQAYTPSATIYR